jgi:hypothetical protein
MNELTIHVQLLILDIIRESETMGFGSSRIIH